SKISAASNSRNALARGVAYRRCALLRDRRTFARTYVRGWDLRSSGRRILPLFGGRALACPAFREDALRQRPAARIAVTRLAAQQKSFVCPARARNCRVAQPRNDGRR